MSFFPLSNDQSDPIAQKGKVVRDVGDRLVHVSAVQSPGGTAKIITITSDADVEDTTEYTGTLDWLGISIPWAFTTDGSGTGTELIAGILASMLEDNNMGILVESYDATTNVLTLTLKAGVDATVTFIDNATTDLSVAYTAAVDPVQFYFGRACEVVGQQQSDGRVVNDIAAGCTSSSVAANLALVLDNGEDIVYDVVGDLTQPVGPRAYKPMCIAKKSGSTQYGVEAPPVAPTWGGAVHVEGANTSSKGRLLTASSGTSVAWTDAKWIGLDPVDSTVAIIEL